MHLIEKETKEWDEFFSQAKQDTVNEWCKELLNAMWETHHVIFVTGRPEKIEADTKMWLYDHLGDNFFLKCSLFMRHDFDRRPDFEVKKEIYRSKLEYVFDIDFAIDDRREVDDMWHSLGIQTLLVHTPDTKEIV